MTLRVLESRGDLASRPSRPTTAPLRRTAAATLGLLEPAGAVASLLLLWELAPRWGWIDAAFFPPLSRVLRALQEIALSGALLEHTLASLLRALSGLSIAIGLAIPLGFFVGRFSRVERILDPLLQTLRQLPTFALFPVFVLLFGIGEAAKIAIIAKAAFWPIFLSTVSGVSHPDADLMRLGRSMCLSSLGLFRRVILPGALPAIFSGLRLSATVAFVMLIAAEMLGARSGLGYFVYSSESRFEIPQMYAGILVLTAYALLLNYGLVAAERRANAWKRREAPASAGQR